MKDKPTMPKPTSKAKPKTTAKAGTAKLDKTPGGGGARKRRTPKPQIDSTSEKNSAIELVEHKEGTIWRGGKKLARLTADSPEAYAEAKGIVEAGFWLQNRVRSWGMTDDAYWQMHTFPNASKNWRKRMEEMMQSTLDNESEWYSQMHEIERTTLRLWDCLHELAEHASNLNFKRQAGRTLGELYHRARLKAGRGKKLIVVNEEFKRALVRFRGGREPAGWLVNWVHSKLWWERELWLRAMEVASEFDQALKEGRVKSGKTLDDAWACWMENRKQRPGADWHEFLSELWEHPFSGFRGTDRTRRALTLTQLTNFETCWSRALEPRLRKLWDTETPGPTLKNRKRPSWKHKFDKFEDDECAGYSLVSEYWKRSFLDDWNRRQEQRAGFFESVVNQLEARESGEHSSSSG
jgi:hypothetical protein